MLMPKPNKALFLFALLSISAFYNLKQSGSAQSDQKIQQALTRLENKLKHYEDENATESFFSEIIEDILVVSQDDLNHDISEVESKLISEKETLSTMTNMLHVKERTQGAKVVRQLRDFHQLKFEQTSQNIYELSKELEALNKKKSTVIDSLIVNV